MTAIEECSKKLLLKRKNEEHCLRQKRKKE